MRTAQTETTNHTSWRPDLSIDVPGSELDERGMRIRTRRTTRRLCSLRSVSHMPNDAIEAETQMDMSSEHRYIVSWRTRNPFVDSIQEDDNEDLENGIIEMLSGVRKASAGHEPRTFDR